MSNEDKESNKRTVEVDTEPYFWTKRERFAMAAMQGILAKFQGQAISCEVIAECSVQQADALLKELSK